MTTKTLFVRILPKTGPETFFRCGMEFSRDWKKKEVDDATAKRLHAEQMLEVTDQHPEDYVAEDEAATAEGAGGDAAGQAAKAKAETKPPAAGVKKR